jgi:hypothetical protein
VNQIHGQHFVKMDWAYLNRYTLILILSITLNASNILEITESDLNEVAQKIYKNECNADINNLVVWNQDEHFLSAGIGHFIWYHKSEKNLKYVESFPDLIEFMHQNGVTLPYFLKESRSNPWRTKEAYLKDTKIKKDLQQFMISTIDFQTKYLIERLNRAVPKMMDLASDKRAFKDQFLRVFNSRGGLYALVDYVNFKGEGIAQSERYNNQGWGLLQVLECMRGEERGKKALSEFSECAKKVLRERLHNAPDKTIEKRWIKGWIKRAESYTKHN